MDTIIKLIKKYREILVYGIVGGGTTVINLSAYYLFSSIIGIQYLISNVLAWIVAFAFAFLANKLWVFESKSFQKDLVIKELASFFFARISTGVLDMLLLFVFVDFIGLHPLVSKVIDTAVSSILNYILSKFWIFNMERKKSSV